jgi:hypothetical protein
MNKGLKIVLQCLQFFFSLYLVPLGRVVGIIQGSMSHAMVHPETWCVMQSNTGIAIYEYLSKLTEKQTIVVSL